MGYYKSALESYTKALELDKNNVKAYMGRGYCKLMINDYVGVKEDMNKVLEIDENNFRAYYYRSIVKYTLWDYTGSLADIDTSLKLNPNFAKAYSVRGMLKYDALNDKIGACLDWLKSVELGHLEDLDQLNKYCN